MINDNISFYDKLPTEDFSIEEEMKKLKTMKNSIDLKLKELEAKTFMYNPINKIMDEETKAKHIHPNYKLNFSVKIV